MTQPSNRWHTRFALTASPPSFPPPQELVAEPADRRHLPPVTAAARRQNRRSANGGWRRRKKAKFHSAKLASRVRRDGERNARAAKSRRKWKNAGETSRSEFPSRLPAPAPAFSALGAGVAESKFRAGSKWRRTIIGGKSETGIVRRSLRRSHSDSLTKSNQICSL